MDADEIGRILDEIGERMGPAGEYVWVLAVRQSYIGGVTGILTGLLLTAICGAGLLWAVHLIRKPKSSYTEEGFAGTFLLIGSFLGVAAGWFIAVSGVHSLLNPEYQAMVRLLDRLVP